MENKYIIAPIILGVGLMIFLSYYYSRKATVKRNLKKAPSRKIADFVSGEIAKVVGKVECVGDALKAPLSGRECAYYYVNIEQKVSNGKSSHWQTLIEEEIGGTFVIRDGRSVAFIKSSQIKSYVVQDRKYTSGFMNDPEPILREYLQKHNKNSENILGFNKTIRYQEGVLEIGELIAIKGRGNWQNASQVSLPDSYGRVLVITETETDPVYLSDDPDTLKEIHRNVDI